MQLSAPRDDVLAGLLSRAKDERVRFRQALQAFDELGKVGRVLHVHGNTDHGAHRVLHVLESVRVLEARNRAGLQQVLVDPPRTLR